MVLEGDRGVWEGRKKTGKEDTWGRGGSEAAKPFWKKRGKL